MVNYQYDAWGNHTLSGNSKIANLNPFRYRGYYFDKETGLYYLQTRYYDPEVGRFISPDNTDYATVQTVNGLNLYAYCGNNPVMRTDSNGTSWSDFWSSVGRFVGGLAIAAVGAAVTGLSLRISLFTGAPLQLGISTMMYGGFMMASSWDPAIYKDMSDIGWNPFNNDADIAANSTKVSFYRGVPVFKISGTDWSMSLGAIFLNTNDAEVLKHERGHNDQLMMLGSLKYLVYIGIPSPNFNEDYTPWELSASMLGGSVYANVTQKGDIVTDEHRIAAWAYLAVAFLLF